MINFPNQTIIGSIQKVRFTSIYFLDSYNPVVLTSGLAWDELEILPDTAKLSFNVAETDNGNLYSYRLEFKHLCLRDEVEVLLDKYVGSRSVFEVTDMNDRVYILGSPYTPCTLSYDADTGAQATDQNLYNINVSVQQINKAFSA